MADKRILFQGNRLDNGELVSGDLIHANKKTYIVSGWTISDDCFDCENLYEIDASTVKMV